MESFQSLNPLYEDPEPDSLKSTSPIPTFKGFGTTGFNTPPAKEVVVQKTSKGRTFALVLVGIAVLLSILALFAMCLVLVFRAPQTTADVDALRQEIESLKQMVDGQDNSQLSQDQLNSTTQAIIREMQLQLSSSTQNLESKIEDAVQKQTDIAHEQNQSLSTLADNIALLKTGQLQLGDLTQSLQTETESSAKQLNESLNARVTTLALDIEYFKYNTTQSLEAVVRNQNYSLTTLIEDLSESLQSEKAISCARPAPPSNGSIDLELGIDYGLGSVATYYCDPGYALVGQTTRTCEDTNGGTVTTGTWSGEPPNCQQIHCLELSFPQNGGVATSTQLLVVGTTANYSCDPGYVLVGEITRTCEDINGQNTQGTWTGSAPVCQEIVTCSSVTQPTNGAVSISSGTHGVNLGVGAIATYTCNTGYGIIGEATRTCRGSNGGTWSGSEPTCQLILTCPSLTNPVNGTITFTPGADNSDIGLGSVATYSCNLGYILVGQNTRECVSAGWNGHAPICQEAVYCPALVTPGNGTVSIVSGVNYLSVGSTATYSCDHGYALLGSTTRTCEDPDSDSVGTWTGSMPTCQVILCPSLTTPENGTLVISESPSQLLGVGSTATYSCDADFVLVGEATRTCEGANSGTTGEWTGLNSSCAIPNGALIDCQDTDCRYEQLVCPDEDNCTVHCYDSRSYACFQTDFFCSRGDECTINCDDPYACLQANITCPDDGDCTVNCQEDYTCLHSAVECSGDNCVLNCDRQESCSDSVIECSSGNCTFNCRGDFSCQYTDVVCPSNGNCTLNCTDYYACRNTEVICPSNGNCLVNCFRDLPSYYYNAFTCYASQFTCPEGGNCTFIFDGQSGGNYIGRFAQITCEENSTCSITCTGLSTNVRYQCQYSEITCPSESGDCNVECSGYWSCQYSTIACGPGEDCLSCTGTSSCYRATITYPSTLPTTLNCTGSSSCQQARITCSTNEPCTINCTAAETCQSAVFTCPSNSNCTINCDGLYSCQNARVTCPTGDHSCNIHCTNPLSCSGLSITNTHNLYLQCCGGLACEDIGITASSTDCPFIN